MKVLSKDAMPQNPRYHALATGLLIAACGDYSAVGSATSNYIQTIGASSNRCAKNMQPYSVWVPFERAEAVAAQRETRPLVGERETKLTPAAAALIEHLAAHPLNPPRQEAQSIPLGTNPRFLA